MFIMINTCKSSLFQYIVVIFFYHNDKYYPQVFLEKGLHKLAE